MKPLTERVALVTGASRGAGRGIAIELGAAGATVYVTGRTVDGRIGTDRLPGTVQATAQAVTDAGGVGIAIRCDHTVDADVHALFQQIETHSRRLDLLVNNVWGGTRIPTAGPSAWSRSGSSRWRSGTPCSRPACGRISP